MLTVIERLRDELHVTDTNSAIILLSIFAILVLAWAMRKETDKNGKRWGFFGAFRKLIWFLVIMWLLSKIDPIVPIVLIGIMILSGIVIEVGKKS